jgi:hypothetical protein
MPRAAVGVDNALRSLMHTALSIEKDPTVAGSLRIGDQNWVIGALIVASLINESSANIRRYALSVAMRKWLWPTFRALARIP